MKKLLFILFIALLLIGCSSNRATANISNKDEVLFKVGEQTVTANTIWEMAKNQGDTINQYIISTTRSTLISEKVPVSDEIKKQAADNLANYKAQLGEFWTKFSGGLSDEEIIEKQFIPIAQETAFFEQYYNDNKDKLLNDKKPVKLYLLQFADSNTATKALDELKNNTALETVITNNPVAGIKNLASEQLVNLSDLPEAVKKHLTDDKLELNQWNQSPIEAGTFYLVKAVELDSSKLEAEFKDAYLSNKNELQAILTDLIKNSNLKIYDQDVYENIKKSKTFGVYFK